MHCEENKGVSCGSRGETTQGEKVSHHYLGQ